jgi:hypothetical protein
LERIWRTRTGSPQHLARRLSAAMWQCICRPRSRPERRERAEGARDHAAQVERDALDLELAGLDLREIEHVRDDARQQLAASTRWPR